MQRFKDILVAVDTRFDTHPELEWATALAEGVGARLKIVDVVPEFSWLARLALPDHDRMRDLVTKEKTEKLEALAGPLRRKGLSVTTKVLVGKTSLGIIHEVLESRHDLVVRSTKGVRSRRRGFFGTTSVRLLRECPCPVWLVKPGTKPRFTRVLAAVDPAPHDEAHSRLNRVIMELAGSIARYLGELYVVHVWELFGANILPAEYVEVERAAEKEVTAAFDKLLLQYDLSSRSENARLLKGDPTVVIPKLVKGEQIDLIVLGTIARTGIPGMLMGNTAELVLDRVECGVLAVKPDGFVSR